MNTGDSSGMGSELNVSRAKMGRINDLNRVWEKVLHLGVKVCYPKNTIIPHGQISGMYYLLNGAVSISYSTVAGRERLALSIGPGCLFNEARTTSRYEPGGRFTCTLDSVLYRFPENILSDADFICTHPDLVANVIQSMGLKMLIHYSFLTDMGIGSPETLLCRFILSLSRKNSGARSFAAEMTQQEIADLLGVHRTTLARAVRQIKQKGIIDMFTRREVRIGNYDLLVRIARQ